MTTLNQRIPGHWSRHAARWTHIGPPLRPSGQDAAAYLKGFQAWQQTTSRADPVAIVMGVTPEVCRLPLPTGSLVMPVERSAEMMGAIWPGPIRPRDRPVRADWRAMPFRDAAVDVVFADVPLCASPFPSGYLAVCVEVRRLLRPRGRWVTRCCVQPERHESADDVFDDLMAGRIGNFHVLKWRLVMALQSEVEAGVVLRDVWNALSGPWSDLDALARRFAWPIDEVRTVEVYRGVDVRYTFPTLAQHREVFAAAGFTVLDETTPTYELGTRFPTLQLARTP